MPQTPGRKVTILCDWIEFSLPDSIEIMVKNQGKEEGGPWDCYSADNFYGWEAERVVAVTSGLNTMQWR